MSAEVAQPWEATPPRPVIALRSAEFRKGREEAWIDLDALITKAEAKGVPALSADELRRLPRLYRTAVSSLSVARSIALDRNLLLYLEGLALRAYFVVYGPRVGLMESFSAFVMRGFPAEVRKAAGAILLAFASILVGVAVGFALVEANEGWFSALAPESLTGGRGPASTAAELRDNEIFAPWPGFVRSFVVFANFLFRHNATIGILSFALGVAGGAPTLVLLAYQGVVFGAFIALHYNRGLLIDFLGWVSIHGVTEFGAIILCGAGGFEIARTILFPGQYSRLENLALRGREAAGLAGGAVLMLFVAGLIEGGFRQLIANTPGRFAFAAATAALWLVYFLRVGRRSGDGAQA
ncbi:MAG: stage II sporulation protein M [Roseiarcus sp.]